MTEVRAHARFRYRPFGVDIAFLAGLFVAASLAANPPDFGTSSPHLSPATDELAGVELTVDPPSFWMRTGTNLTLTTVWSTGSPLCRLTPTWYHWTLVSEGATGFLNSTTGPSTIFTGDSFGSGNVTVEVQAGAVVDCSGSENVVDRSVSSHVTVVVPLSLSGVEIGPDPLWPGEPATLVGTITGGSPPYTLDIDWTDSTLSVVTLSGPGSFSFNHTFPAGEFSPYVVAMDSGGNLVNRSVGETLSVGTGFVVAVVPTSFIAEVGVPTVFSGVVQDPPLGDVILFTCTNATVVPVEPPPWLANATSFSCSFRSPGTSEILFGVYPPSPGGISATAVLYETVVDPPVLNVEPNASTGEVGGSAFVRVSLSGGAPPFALQWNLTGNRSSGQEGVDSDGGGVLALPLQMAGEYSLGIRAADSLGEIDFNGATIVRADPALEARANGASSYLAEGALVQVAGEILAGCPPFSWWVAPGITPPNETSPNGSLSTVGGFSWSGPFAQEGNVSVNVGVADACGAAWQTVLVVQLVPPLSVGVDLATGSTPSGQTLMVNLSVASGWAPFQLFVNSSDNQSWNRTLPSDGVYHCTLPTDANGSLTLTVTVTDALGARAVSNLTVMLSPWKPPPSVSPPSDGTGPSNGSGSLSFAELLGLAGSLALPTVTAAAWVTLRRRRAGKAAGSPPGPDPVATLKQIIEPTEGSERFTVELLAEEAGVPLAVVRSTIDRLVAQGVVKSESGADGEEVLTWSPESGR